MRFQGIGIYMGKPRGALVGCRSGVSKQSKGRHLPRVSGVGVGGCCFIGGLVQRLRGFSHGVGHRSLGALGALVADKRGQH